MPDLELIRTMALPYCARPGIVTLKDADDDGTDDGDDIDDDEDEESDDSDDDDPDAEKTDEELRAELKEVRQRLAKANGSSKAKRLRARKLQQQLDEARRKPQSKGKTKGDESDDDAPDIEAIRESARQEARAESDNRVKRAGIRAELRSAGIPTESAGRLVGLVKLDDLDVDDEGNVDGLDEVIDELRADFPQLFGDKGDEMKRTARRSVAGRENTDTKRRKLSTDQAQAKALLR